MPTFPTFRLPYLLVALLAAAVAAPPTPLAAQPSEHVLRQPRLTIGATDGAEAYLLFGARQAHRLSDGRIVLANLGTQQLRLYDAGGRHLRTIGRRGSGPGEFTGLQQLGVIRGDTIVAYDLFQARVSIFSPSGDLVRTYSVQPFANEVAPRAVGFTGSGEVVVHTDFGRVFVPGEHRDSITFGVVGVSGTPGTTLGRYAGEEYFILASAGAAVRRPIAFGRDTYASARGDHIVIGSSDSFRISVFDGSGRPRRVQTGERPARPVQQAEVRALDEKWLEGVRAEMREGLRRETSRFPHRAMYPAFAGLLVDAAGRIWVEEFESPTATERRWTVYGSNGAVLRRVRGSAGMRVVDAGDDYVLVRHVDDYGVESIRLFDLPRLR
jgi:hypothetical protein